MSGKLLSDTDACKVKSQEEGEGELRLAKFSLQYNAAFSLSGKEELVAMDSVP